MLKLTNLHLPLNFKQADLTRAAAAKLKMPEKGIRSCTLWKKSVDARKKDNVCFVCAVEVEIDGNEEKVIKRLRDNSVQKCKPYAYEPPAYKQLPSRPVVVGFGPAGMFAALLLARCGQRPIVIERGQPVEKRQKTVETFWKTGVLNTESNVQFGEGGAGTFSDGKLNTGTGDSKIRKVLEDLVAAGAPEEILTDAKPHVGTDRLPQAVKNIREEIISLGGEVRFETKAKDFRFVGGQLSAVVLEDGEGRLETLPCTHLILAVGHSARDTFQQLYDLGLPMEAKSFSAGVRIEHPAALINQAQYGNFAGHPALGAADYKLSRHLDNGRGVYTFCMCPGGTVTGAASEEGGVVTNGMSPWARDGEHSNAALLVGISPKDYGAEGPLAGIAFQRKLERAAFVLGGGTYCAPAQRVEDFLEGKKSAYFGDVKPTYEPGCVPAKMEDCLPSFITESLRQAIPQMGRMLKGFDYGDALLTAPETRSSSPVRVLRGEDFQSPLCKGLFPCGEGAGYAGGIVSAAVDGMRCAEQVLRESMNV